MAEIAAGFLGPALEVVKWVSAPILRQFNYLCCFSGNITSLKNEAEKLHVTERDLQRKVDTARNDVRVISGEVETWLEKFKDINDETDGILHEVPNVESGCLKLRARFSLCKRAKKTSDRLKQLRGRCKFDADSISRNRDVLSVMNVQKIFGMEVLSEEDSWFLFRTRAGKCVDDTKLNSIAKEVVTKCAGLPIALTTVGASLKDDMHVPIWEDALEQLKGCAPDIPEIIANVYNPLRLSYNVLGPKH